MRPLNVQQVLLDLTAYSIQVQTLPWDRTTDVLHAETARAKQQRLLHTEVHMLLWGSTSLLFLVQLHLPALFLLDAGRRKG